MPEISLESIVVRVLVLIFLGVLTFLIHGIFVNRYLRNQNYMLLGAILPVTAMTIVTAIMTNVWLSLGLIGALSIVRFRTPVKSSYELALIFVLITAGVVGAISLPGAIIFVTTIILIAPCYALATKFAPNLFLQDYRSLDNQYEILIRISGSLRPESLDPKLMDNLLSIDEIHESDQIITTAIFRFINRKDMMKFRESLDGQQNIISLNINNVNSTAIF